MTVVGQDPLHAWGNEQKQRALRREIERLHTNWRTLMFTDAFLWSKESQQVEARPIAAADLQLQKDVRNGFVRFGRWYHRLPGVDKGILVDSETLTEADHAQYVDFLKQYDGLQARVQAAAQAQGVQVNAGAGKEHNVPPAPEAAAPIPPWVWALGGAAVLWWITTKQKGRATA